MRNFVIAAAALLVIAGYVSPSEAGSKARALTTAEPFVQELKSSGQFEIESSLVALQRTRNEAIRNFAQKMVEDHQAADQKLMDTLKQANLPGPEYGMTAEQQDVFNQLFATTEPQFDGRYVQDQIKGHEDAVALLETYAQKGDNDALKQLASTLLPTIKEHLQMAGRLRSSVTARR